MVAPSQSSVARRPSPVALRPREPHRPALPLYAATILAVTADSLALTLIGNLLRQANLDHHARFLDCARQTQQFLTRCAADRTPPPRILLVDLHVAGSAGLRLLRWIRAQDALQGMTVVALGFQNSEQDAAPAFAAGAHAYLAKHSREPELAPLGLLLRSVVERGRQVRWTAP